MGLQIHWAGLVFICLGFPVWVIALGGLAATTSYCHTKGEDGKKENYETCARIYQWEWWGLWFEFFLLVAILITCATRHFKTIRTLWLSYMTMCTVVLMLGARNFITGFFQGTNQNIKDYADAARGAAATGFTCMCIVNFVIIIFLAIEHNPTTKSFDTTTSKFSPYMPSAPYSNANNSQQQPVNSQADSQFQASSV